MKTKQVEKTKHCPSRTIEVEDSPDATPTLVGENVDPELLGFGERMGLGNSYLNPYEDSDYR